MNHDDSLPNRREFMQMGLLGSGMLLGVNSSFGSTLRQGTDTSSSFGIFDSLPVGAISPEGWLLLYLKKQADQLGSHLPEVSWPFTDQYWAGEETAESWWPWEQRAYWIDGATRLGLVLNDENLLKQVEVPITYTLQHATNGYLGPAYIRSPKESYHRWPHTVFFRALAAMYDAGRHGEIADAIRIHYLSDNANYGKPFRNATNIEMILWCYQRTGDKRLLSLAEESWKDFFTLEDPLSNPIDLSALRVYSAAPINAHGISYSETSKQPAILYLATGNKDYLNFALAAQRRIFDHHMLISGVPSTSEFYRTRTSLDSHETCSIVDHMWTWSYMLMATGDGLWADHIESALFNAGFGAIKKDWKGVQYFSCPNQFLATQNSDHNILNWKEGRAQDGGQMMAYQPNPGRKTACCGGNVHRMLPNYVLRMWMKESRGGLAATFYGPSRVRVPLGADNQEVEIHEETNYPFEETVNFTVRCNAAVHFPLLLRIPTWCATPQIAINGMVIPTPRLDGSFARIERLFRPGDKITLTLPMRPKLSYWPQNGIGVEHGPVVYSLAIKGRWTPFVDPPNSTSSFPSWNLTPDGVWNYGLAFSARHPEEQIQVVRKAATEDPWLDPPISLEVPSQQIEGWNLQVNPVDPQQQFTPPLPDPQVKLPPTKIEKLALTPYGSTHLRLTIFPNLTSPDT